MKEILRVVIKEQRKQQHIAVEVERTMPRELIDSQEIIVISGLRRCGKSVLLQQIRKKQREQDFFINFDDERLINFQVEHFQLLHEVFIKCTVNKKLSISMRFKTFPDGSVLSDDCTIQEIKFS